MTSLLEEKNEFFIIVWKKKKKILILQALIRIGHFIKQTIKIIIALTICVCYATRSIRQFVYFWKSLVLFFYSKKKNKKFNSKCTYYMPCSGSIETLLMDTFFVLNSYLNGPETFFFLFLKIFLHASLSVATK